MVVEELQRLHKSRNMSAHTAAQFSDRGALARRLAASAAVVAYMNTIRAMTSM